MKERLTPRLHDHRASALTAGAAKLAAVLLLTLLATACVYHMPIRQGNILTQDKINKLKVGMTQSQVKYLLGPPLANDPFTFHKWMYLYYYKSPDNDVSERVLHLYFKNNRLARIKGPIQLRGEHQSLGEVEEQPKPGPTPGESRKGANAQADLPTNPNRQRLPRP